MSSGDKTVQVRVSTVAKRAIEIRAEQIKRSQGLNLSWGDVLLQLLNDHAPDLVREALREEDNPPEQAKGN